MKKAIIINGPARSGKDSFIMACRVLLREQNIPVYSVTSIFPIKDFMFKEEGWDGVTKTEEIRNRMVEVKQQMISDGDVPYNYCVERYLDSENGIFFFHIREADEITKFVEGFKTDAGTEVITAHLERSDEGYEYLQTAVDSQGRSREYKNYDYDLYNNYDGLGEIFKLAHEFLENLNIPHTNLYESGEFGSKDEVRFELLEKLNNPELHKEFDDQAQAGYQ